MATTLGLDPCTLKFTAVKVDVSAVTSRAHSKAFVISSQTTSRDLTNMVLGKLGLVGSAAPSVGMIGKNPAGGEQFFLEPQQKILALYPRHKRKALTFQLVPQSHVANHPDEVITCQPPGGARTTDHSHPNGWRGSGSGSGAGRVRQSPLVATERFATSTPDLCDPSGSPRRLDRDFRLSYSPVTYHPARQSPEDGRCHSLDFNPDSQRRQADVCVSRPDSLGNRSDPCPDINGDGALDLHRLSGSERHLARNGRGGHTLVDGFQILQQQRTSGPQGRGPQGRAAAPRHASEGTIPGIAGGLGRMKLTSSDPDALAGGAAKTPPASSSSSSSSPGSRRVTSLRRRRSLPKMSITEASVAEKRRSVTDLFASKLRRYVQKAQQRAQEKREQHVSDYQTPRTDLRSHRPREDDDVSVTSEEVAEILACASPMKPNEDDFESDDDDKVRLNESEARVDATANEEDASFVTNDSGENTPVLRGSTRDVTNLTPSFRGSTGDVTNLTPVSNGGSAFQKYLSLKDLRAKSQEQIQKEQPPVLAKANAPDSHAQRAPTSNTEHADPPGVDRRGAPDPPPAVDLPSPVHPDPSPSSPPTRRGLPLFVLLTTHHLALATVRQAATNGHVGIRFCDVTYAKCVRHVVRYSASPDGHLDLHGNEDKRLVAIGGLDGRAAAIETGRLYRGDVVVEVNGSHVLALSAREVSAMVRGQRTLHLVLARPKQNVERAQSP